MHALSDAIRLREAIMAERRAERTCAAGNTVAFPAVATPAAGAKTVRPGFLAKLRAIACL